MLQSEAGYIDARPHRQIEEISCNARPDHTFGSKGEELTLSKTGPLCVAHMLDRDHRVSVDGTGLTFIHENVPGPHLRYSFV
jgi:hypothetical protein